MGVLSILNNQLSRIGGAGLGVESKERVRWKNAQLRPKILRDNAITTLSPVRCARTVTLGPRRQLIQNQTSDICDSLAQVSSLQHKFRA